MDIEDQLVNYSGGILNGLLSIVTGIRPLACVTEEFLLATEASQILVFIMILISRKLVCCDLDITSLAQWKTRVFAMANTML